MPKFTYAVLSLSEAKVSVCSIASRNIPLKWRMRQGVRDIARLEGRSDSIPDPGRFQ